MHTGEKDISFEKRMMNWRDTVLSRGGSGGGCCAGWAANYVASRNSREVALAISLEILQPSSSLAYVGVNELDGWLIEAAVKSLIHFDQKQVLRFKYVWEYPDHWIKSKLLIRDNALRIVLGRAIINLKNILEMLESPATIRSYNLHAGIVPRLEASAVPVGAVAPLEC